MGCTGFCSYTARGGVLGRGAWPEGCGGPDFYLNDPPGKLAAETTAVYWLLLMFMTEEVFDEPG